MTRPTPELGRSGSHGRSNRSTVSTSIADNVYYVNYEGSRARPVNFGVPGVISADEAAGAWIG